MQTKTDILVDGYIRNVVGVKERRNMVTDIVSCIFNFYQVPMDSFDASILKQVCDDIQLSKKNTKAYVSSWRGLCTKRYLYLSKTISEGRHSWTFKIDKMYSYGNSVGIWKTNCKYPKIPVLGDGVHDKHYWFGVHYGWLSGEWKEWSYRKTPCKDGDIIQMILDMDKLELSFKVNDQNLGIAFKIEDTEYRAAVQVFSNGDSWQLLNSSHKLKDEYIVAST